MLPWFQATANTAPRTVAHLNDCKKCMTQLTKEQRLLIGCGYEPPHPSARPWGHAKRKGEPDEVDERGKQLAPVCPGYVCRLPEVIEAAHAHFHWKNGSLHHYCNGQQPTERLLTAIEVIEHNRSDCEAWRLEEATKKNGGER